METLRSGTAWFTVDDATAAGTVRRAAIRLAENLAFSPSRTGEVGIVASELASNVHRHGHGGNVGVQVVLRRGRGAVQLVAVDRGPGMDDHLLSARDGHSTAGTLGVGMGAITRLSSRLDVSSHPGTGTVLVCEIGGTSTTAAEGLDVGGVTRPMTGEVLCGDAIAGRNVDGIDLLMACDGLGHGPLAADASNQAVDSFHSSAERTPQGILTELNTRLNGTRGAAIAVAAVDIGNGSLTFAGIGNVSVSITDGGERRPMSSQPGIVGHRMPRVRQLEFPFGEAAVMIMHSDGVRDRWNLADTPGLARRDASVIAACLLRDWADRPDDASVLVARRWR